MDNKQLEDALAAQTEPRVTPEQIEGQIVGEVYINAYDAALATGADTDITVLDKLRTMTLCFLILKNGYTVTGQSACAHPDNFDENIGKKIARDDAVGKIWALEGYVLKSKLSGTL
jgi:hypothetical protein